MGLSLRECGYKFRYLVTPSIRPRRDTGHPTEHGNRDGMKRIALLIETSRTYGRELLAGVRRFAAESAAAGSPWSMFVEVRDLESRPPPWLAAWDGDGILTRSGNEAIAHAVQAVAKSTVELRSTRKNTTFPFVGIDNELLGRQAAEEFLNRGFRSFGVYGLDTEEFFVTRRDSFVACVREAGFHCEILNQNRRTEKPRQWEAQQKRISTWLQAIPKPAAVLACTDQLGCWLLDACSRADLRVPDDIAVIGVENDESLCDMSTPPLSSVSLGGERVGYEAAAILDRMMNGRRPPRRLTLFPPDRIVIRQSSDLVAIDDEHIALALQFIRRHADQSIGVDNVARHVGVSRSTLERRFRLLLDRTPADEIQRARLSRVRDFLRFTDQTLEQIAAATGFDRPQTLSELFRRVEGVTPGQFRKQCR